MSCYVFVINQRNCLKMYNGKLNFSQEKEFTKTECLHRFLHSDNQLMSSEVKCGGLKMCVV